MAESIKHKELSNTAINWLYHRGCSVFGHEIDTWNGIADALGIITNKEPHTIYYIEAKTSRSDLLCLKQRACYKRTEDLIFDGHGKETRKYFGEEVGFSYPNDIDFFYFIVADGLKIEPNLYPLWGVINSSGVVIRKARRMKKLKDSQKLIIKVGHKLVYKVYGKLYETPIDIAQAVEEQKLLTKEPDNYNDCVAQAEGKIF